jgi:hypothetical protein
VSNAKSNPLIFQNIEEAFFSLVREVRKTLPGNSVAKDGKKKAKRNGKLKCKLI